MRFTSPIQPISLILEKNQQRMHAENLKKELYCSKKTKIRQSPLLGRKRLDIFQAQHDTINGYRTLPNATEHDFSDGRINVTLNFSLSKP